MHGYFGAVDGVRVVLQRGMAAIYFVAFLTVVRQFKPLLGERGLLPVPEYLEGTSFWEAPSLFQWRYSDRLVDGVAWTGLVTAACAVLGLTERGPLWMSVGAWLLLWVLYLSVVNVGQRFYGFGWESMLLEAGFFTAFLGPRWMAAPLIPVLILRWMLFRTEVGAGLIKLRGDACWRDLTALYYHYETQPLPNALSRSFHGLPMPVQRMSVLFSHVVQVVVPFALFAPQPYAAIAAGLTMGQQLLLIVSGNYSWLNWLTALLGFAGFSDGVLRAALPRALWPPAVGVLASRPLGWEVVLWGLALATVALSVQPVLNLLSRKQRMNYSYNRFHLVNTYGAFGSVGRERYEIVLEGTTDRVVSPATEWRAYEFKAKPGDVRRRPPQVAPYHLRLDWMVWFLPFAVAVTPRGVRVRGYDLWFVRFVRRLLLGDAGVLGLMAANPFAEGPPALVRAQMYRYHFADRRTRSETGAWWTRELLGTYLPAVSVEVLESLGDV